MAQSRTSSPQRKRARVDLDTSAEQVAYKESPPAPQSPPLDTAVVGSRWAVTWNNHPSEALRQATLSPRDDYTDLLAYQQSVTPALESLFSAQLEAHGPFKAKVTLSIWLSKGDTECFGFTSGAYNEQTDTLLPVVSRAVVRAQIEAMFAEVARRVDEFLHLGSGWTVATISWLEVRMVAYAALGHALAAGGAPPADDVTGTDPVNAQAATAAASAATASPSSFIATPPWLALKKCVVNVRVPDQSSFRYAVLAGLHRSAITKNRERVGSYSGVLASVDFTGVPFPTTVADAAAFSERAGIPLFVLSLDVTDPENRAFTMEHHNTVSSTREPVHLLRLHRGPQHAGHFTCITRLNAFARENSTNIHCCPRCMRQFKEQSALDRHREAGKCIADATKSAPTRLLPPASAGCKFTSVRKQLPAPFVVYADCEAILTRVDFPQGNKTRVYQQHTVNHIGAVVVSRYPALLCHDYIQFDGPDCVVSFLQWLFGIEARAVQLLKRNVPMRLTRADAEAHASATSCHICGNATGTDKVRDHDHLTGEYRGAAHAACNLAFNYKGFCLPVFFHNLERYDGHFILQHAGKFKRRMSCVAKNAESFLSFTIGQCVFKDTKHFLQASLEEVVDGLNAAVAAGALVAAHFPCFEHAFSASSLELRALLRRKGVFPYDWFDSASKLDEYALPSHDAFASQLKGEPASSEDVARAYNVWALAGCHRLYDYLSLYSRRTLCCWQTCLRHFAASCSATSGWTPLTTSRCLGTAGTLCSRPPA